MDLNSESATQEFCHVSTQPQTAASLLGKEEPNSQAALRCSAAGRHASLMGMCSSRENRTKTSCQSYPPHFSQHFAAATGASRWQGLTSPFLCLSLGLMARRLVLVEYLKEMEGVILKGEISLPNDVIL